MEPKPKQIAVNILDATNAEVMMAAQILLPQVTPGRIMVNAEPKNLDGMAVVLECDLARAASIVWVMWRKVAHTNKMRAYIGSGKTWKRLDDKSIREYLLAQPEEGIPK